MLKLEIYNHGALIDGMVKVTQVGQYKQMFPKGNIYRGGLALAFDDYPLDEIRKTLAENGRSLDEVVGEDA